MNINVISRPRIVRRYISIPVYKLEIDVRKHEIAGILLMLGALAIPFLMAIKIIELGFVLAFVGFGLALAGGVLFLIQSGEIN